MTDRFKKILTITENQFKHPVILLLNGILTAVLAVTVYCQYHHIFADTRLLPVRNKSAKSEYAHPLPQKISAALDLFSEKNPAPRTAPGLVLKGIILSEKADGNYAVLGTAYGDEKLYRKGDRLPDSAVIQKIQPGEVLLERNGLPVTLRIPWGMHSEDSPVRTPRAPVVNIGKPFSMMKD